MKQDMIVILDLGSHENTVLARAIRALGVYSEIYPHDITVEELKAWIPLSGLPVKKFFNTSGLVYKELNLKEKLTTMSEEEQIALLATNGKLVKRPLVVTDHFVLVGFKPDEWEKLK